jgi:hypothetical protein
MAGALPGTSVLDAPPPPPGVVGGDQSQMPTLSGLAQPVAMSSGQLPPEILTGIVQACQKITGMFDSFAQVTPDLAMDWDLCKTVLDKTLGKVMSAGGGATSPQAPGPQFPGGGLSAGTPQAGPQ